MVYSKVKRKSRRRYLIIILGIFLFFFGTILLITKNISIKKEESIQEKSIEKYFNNESTEQSEDITNVDNKQDELYDYDSIIEIPKINLKKGLFEKTSINNNVDKNIYVLSESTYPNETEYSHILLASHSGNSYVSYFRNLNDLWYDDLIYIYHNGNKYTYKVITKYDIEKTGKANIGLYKKNLISLITCIDGTNKQLVIVGELMED